MKPPELPPPIKYWVAHNGERLGPFAMEFIEAMVMANVYPPSIKIWTKGCKDWLPLSSVTKCNSITSIMGQKTPNNCDSNQTKSREIKKPKNKFETILPWALGVFCVMFVIWIVNQATSSKTAKKTLTQSDLNSPLEMQTSKSNRRSDQYSTGNESISQSRVIRQKETGRVFQDAAGRSYRVPDLAYRRLLDLRSELVEKKISLDLEDGKLQYMSDRLDQDRIRLNANSEYEVEAFNSRVKELNQFSSKVQDIVNTFNRDVHDFNTELKRAGTPIN